jgi:hypothetical protein
MDRVDVIDNVEGKELNTCILTIDFDRDVYTLTTIDGEPFGSASPTASLTSTGYSTIQTFTSIDTGKLSITSSSANKGNVDLRAVKVKDNVVHYSTASALTPGNTWITAGGLSAFTNYRVEGKASSGGTYSFTMKW